MSLFSNIGSFLSKVWKSLSDNTDTVAIAITEEIQSSLKSGVLSSVATIVEDILPTTGKLPDEVVSVLSTEVPKILAFELAIKGLPANPTTADIQAFEADVLTAFGVTTNTSKLWTTLAAQLYAIIEAQVNSGSKLTFAQCVSDVESAYQDYVSDQASS